MKEKKPKPEIFARMHSRITVRQATYLKKEKNRTGKSEGTVLRELLDLAINKNNE